MIATQNYTIEEGEAGVSIGFPKPVGLIQGAQYIVSFDAPITLPKNPPVTVSFEPLGGSYSIFGSSSFDPRVFVKIKSLQKIQTKTLLRLIIKDTKNNIIHIDYILIVCSPISLINIAGTLMPQNVIGGIGPNGGGVIRITTSSNNAQSIVVGSKVVGPGVPASKNAFVRSIINVTDIELDRTMDNGAGSFSGTYDFSFSLGCIDATKLVENNAFSSFTILDFKNNWTYRVRDQIIAKFIVKNPSQNQDMAILLPVKNTALLGQIAGAEPIPEICIFKAGGRVINDTIPISVI